MSIYREDFVLYRETEIQIKIMSLTVLPSDLAGLIL